MKIPPLFWSSETSSPADRRLRYRWLLPHYPSRSRPDGEVLYPQRP